MPRPGWERLLDGGPWFRGEGVYPLAAYSEFMPPPRLGPSPYGAVGPRPFVEGEPWGWQITEHEEAFELRPGLEQVAVQVVAALVHLGRGKPAHASDLSGGASPRSTPAEGYQSISSIRFGR